MAGLPRGFSSLSWKDHGERYPYAVAIGCYCALYLVFLAALRSGMAFGASIPLNLLALGCAGFFHVVPAMRAVRFFSSRKALMAMKRRALDLPREARDHAAATWMNAGVRDIAMSFFLHLLLLVPVYLLGAHMGGVLGLPGGVLLLLTSSSAILFSVTLGTYLGLRLKPGMAGSWAAGVAAAFFVVKMLVCGWLVFVMSEELGAGFYGLLVAAAGDAIVSLLAAGGLLLKLPSALGDRRRNAQADYGSEREVIADAPENYGLDVGFSVLARWIFIEDPFYLAEKRIFWSGSRQMLLWVVVVVTVLAGRGSATAVYVWTGYSSLAGLVGSILCRPGFWIAPAIVVVGIAADSRNGLLEDLLLTPVAPLRICLGKLVGRCGKLVFVSVTAVLVSSLVCVGRAQFLGETGSLDPAAEAAFRVGELVLTPVGVLLYGAVGLYFSARFRSMVTALFCSYLFLAATEFAGMCFASDLPGWFSRTYFGRAEPLSYVMRVFAGVIILVLLMRLFVLGAARQLVLRKGD